jgi:PKD repeat protein
MANTPPNAILKVIPATQTLPLNKVTLDGADSYDRDKNGRVVNWQFKVNGVIVSDNDTKVVTYNAPISGNYSVELKVRDARGLTSTAATDSFVINPMPVVTTQWGALLAGLDVEQKVTIIQAFGGTCCRILVTLSSYDGSDHAFEVLTDAGIKVIPNLSWDPNGSNKFVNQSQYSAYKAKLQQYLTKYKPEVVVLENEPTTDVFFLDNIQNYIDQLAFAVPIVKAFGVKVTDGAIHVPLIEQCMNAGSRILTGNAGDVQKLIEAFKTIPTDYVNIHCKASGNSVPIDYISKAANYLRVTCKKEIMSNEWHIVAGSPASLMTSMVAAWKAAKPAYCLVYSGGDGNEAISSGNDLTTIGIAYKNAIA